MGITSHWHLVKDRKAGIATLRSISPQYVRVSSLQAECINGSTIGAVRQLLDAGFRVMPVITSDKAGTLTVDQWRAYVTKAVMAMPPLNGRGVHLFQVLNESNTARFWGRPPNSRVAFERFRIAVDIIRARHPALIYWPGLTNENKTDGETKIAASRWIADWLDFGAQFIADATALHFYDTDQRLSRIFKANVATLRAAGKPVVVTETGSVKDPVGWYKAIRDNGLHGVDAGACCHYCHFGHKEFDAPPALIKEMQA